MEVGQGNKAAVVETTGDLTIQERESAQTVDRKRKYEVLDNEDNDKVNVKEPRLEIQDSFNLLYSIVDHHYLFDVIINKCYVDEVEPMAYVSKKMLAVVTCRLKGISLWGGELDSFMRWVVPTAMHLSVARLSKHLTEGVTTIHMETLPQHSLIMREFGDIQKSFSYYRFWEKQECDLEEYVRVKRERKRERVRMVLRGELEGELPRESLQDKPGAGLSYQNTNTRVLNNLHLIQRFQFYNIETEHDYDLVKTVISQAGIELSKILLKGCVRPSFTSSLHWTDVKETLVIRDLDEGTHRIPPVINLKVYARGNITLDLPETITCLSIGKVNDAKCISHTIDFKIPSMLQYLEAKGSTVADVLSRGIPDSLKQLHVDFLDDKLSTLLKTSKITHLYVDHMNDTIARSLPISIACLVVGRIVCFDIQNDWCRFKGESLSDKASDKKFLKNPTYSFSSYRYTNLKLLEKRKLSTVFFHIEGTEPPRLFTYDFSHLINLTLLVVPSVCEHLKLGSKLFILIWGTKFDPMYPPNDTDWTMECIDQPKELVRTNCLGFDRLASNGNDNNTRKYVFNDLKSEVNAKDVSQYDLLLALFW